MKILLVGGTGVIGRALRRQLHAGHNVAVLTRSEQRAQELEVGIQGIVGDLLDADSTLRAVERFSPDAIIHQATAIPASIHPRQLAKEFEVTNRLRTQGTANLVRAVRQYRVGQLVAQSIAFAYAPQGPRVVNEDAPLNLAAPKQFRPIVEAIAELERLVLSVEGVVLRYGHLYGPGTAYAPDGEQAQQIRKRRLPSVGDGGGTFSFLHVDDAAAAAVAALNVQGPEIFNIVDDDPAPVREWLPHLASVMGARKPWIVPAALARVGAGAYGVEYMTKLRGASNTRAKERLDWTPAHKTWRDGFKRLPPPTDVAKVSQ